MKLRNPITAICQYVQFMTSVPTKREQALKNFQDAEIAFMLHAKATIAHRDAALVAAQQMRMHQTELSDAVQQVNRTDKEMYLSNAVFSPPLNSKEF